MDLGLDERVQPRTFFPGEEDRRRWVPIFSVEHGSNVDKSLRREQFPLVLAWALTHWKCQGMTLRRSRVRIGRRGAATAGVPFTTITRVKHPGI